MPTKPGGLMTVWISSLGVWRWVIIGVGIGLILYMGAKYDNDNPN
jgi:hypothetical protein